MKKHIISTGRKARTWAFPTPRASACFARIVTETGETVEAVAFRIKYSEANAHLYARAEMLVTRSEGGLANRENPEILISAHLFAAMQNGIRQ